MTIDDEAWGGAHWRLFREHRPTGAYLPVGQMDGDCHACDSPWPCRPVREALAERDAAREQALREEIATRIENERETPTSEVDLGYNQGIRDAARIAREEGAR